MIAKLKISLLFIALVAAFNLPLIGCGSDNSPKTEPKVEEDKRVETAKEMRSYFDKSHGNYDSLSPEDKAALDKLTGGEKQSKEAFGHMGGAVSH